MPNLIVDAQKPETFEQSPKHAKYVEIFEKCHQLGIDPPKEVVTYMARFRQEKMKSLPLDLHEDDSLGDEYCVYIISSDALLKAINDHGMTQLRIMTWS